jgi:hypothetical protein
VKRGFGRRDQLALAQAAIGITSDRQFLGLIGRVLPGWFPHLPDQSQYNRRLRQLVGLISLVQQRLARWPDSGDIRLCDGTLIGVANYPGCQQRSDFAGFARFGFAKSQHRFVYGDQELRTKEKPRETGLSRWAVLGSNQ